MNFHKLLLYVILDSMKLSPLDEENEILNAQGVNVLFSALDVTEFNRVRSLKCEGGQVIFA